MPLKNSTLHTKTDPLLYSQKTYPEIIQYLNTNWQKSSHLIIQKLNQALGNLSSKLSSIIIAGTNGKTTTIHYLEEILRAKNITTGSFSSPHFITYNERFRINGQTISNEKFTELANKTIRLAEELQIPASSKDVLTAMALILFHEHQVELAIFEQEDTVNRDPVTICSPIILGIPQIIEKPSETAHPTMHTIIDHISAKTHVISADQSKSHLKIMSQRTTQQNGIWVMPIRKVAPLAYPFEQLFGRYGALADRIVQTYLEHHAPHNTTHSTTSNVTHGAKSSKAPTSFKAPTFAKKQITKTADPSLQSKKIKNLHLSSLDFWQTINNNIPNKFQIITQGNSTIVLDNADNLDAFNDLFLGIRLLNYQHSFQSISLIVGCIQEQCDEEAFIKLLRSYFKKNLDVVSFCPVSSNIGEKKGSSWNIQHLMNVAQYAKFKTMQHPNLLSAIRGVQIAIKEVSLPSIAQDTKQNLLVITGSQAIIAQYWALHNNKEATSSVFDIQGNTHPTSNPI